jgi:hypothetical protein
MAALIRETPAPLTAPEASLMLQWLDAITTTKDAAAPPRSRRKR